MRTVRLVNKWLYDQAPWKLKGDENATQRTSIVRCALECVYVCAHLLAPLLPNACEAICHQLSAPVVKLHELDDSLMNLQAGAHIVKLDVLFAKKEVEKQEEPVKNPKKAAAAKQSASKAKNSTASVAT
jgi:methionyl-tRNA synthetase